MHILIIPGFTSYPEDETHLSLMEQLRDEGHQTTLVNWPHIPNHMDRYSMSETLKQAREVAKGIDTNDLIIIGYSMGGIIATELAAKINPSKLVLIVSSYQVGNEEDLAGKYKEWMQTRQRVVKSSKYGELTVPFSFVEDAQQYNALETIRDVHCPVLFLVAGADDKISRSISERFYAAANAPKEWKIIPGMQHKFKYQEGMVEKVSRAILEFILT